MSYWDLEEGGGGLDGAAATITDAYFAEGDYGWRWIIVNTFDDPENYPKFEDGSFTRYYSLGKGWSSQDGGESATHESGDDNKRYNKNSQVGKFVAQLASVAGVVEALPDFNPYQSKSLKGLHLRWQNIPVTKRAPVTVDGKETWQDVEGATELYPVELIGAAGSNGAATSTIDIASLALTAEQTGLLAAAATDDAFMKVLLEQGLASNQPLMRLVSSDMAGLRAALTF